MAQQFAFAPVAFAVTEGPSHALRYANQAFQQLQTAGDIVVGTAAPNGERRPGDVTPLLDRAFHNAETIRDELLTPPVGNARWSCTVWPIAVNTTGSPGLVVEVRDAAYVEAAIARQRAIAERLLLGALREQDTAHQATEASLRATFLAAASRDLARSLDQEATRELVRRSALPRAGTWCIVDIIEPNGSNHRLAVIHPDPAKQDLAKTLVDHWYPKPDEPVEALSLSRLGGKPVVITEHSGAALVTAARGLENLAVLQQLGFGALLVVPLMVRSMVVGTMTFVSGGDDSFSFEEIALASDLADRCAMALDNARLYRETDALRAAANAANRAKSEFLGTVGHELRTPLYAIGSYVELLELATNGPLSEEQRTDLGRIKHNQRHLATLISQILNFVRTDSGRMEYQFTEVPVLAALQDVADLLDGAIRERQLALDVQAWDARIAVWADTDRVRQILMNLVMNAVKYSRPGSGNIALGFSTTDDSVNLYVADVGPGIPTEKLGAIFEQFVQLPSPFGNRQGGFGLGLAISRDLARAMHGDLTVESTVDVGSRFTLTLPRAPHDVALAHSPELAHIAD